MSQQLKESVPDVQTKKFDDKELEAIQAKAKAAKEAIDQELEDTDDYSDILAWNEDCSC